MPVYEYRCLVCEAEFERLVGRETRVACPRCAAPEVERRLSVFGIGRAVPPAAPTGGRPAAGCCGGGCGCGR